MVMERASIQAMQVSAEDKISRNAARPVRAAAAAWFSVFVDHLFSVRRPQRHTRTKTGRHSYNDEVVARSTPPKNGRDGNA